MSDPARIFQLDISPDRPSALAQAVWRQAVATSEGIVSDTDFAGVTRQAANAALYRRAVMLARVIEAQTPAEAEALIAIESALDFVVALWACILAQRSAMPWHHQRSAPPSKTFGARFAALAPKLRQPFALTTAPVRAAMGAEASGRFSKILLIEDCSDPGGDIAQAPFVPKSGAADAAMPAFLIATSGTTAEPKLAVVSYSATLARLAAMFERTGARAQLLQFPLDSIGGIGFGLLLRTANAFLQPDRAAAQPQEALDLVERLGLASTGWTSSHAARTLEAAQASGRSWDLSSLVHVGFGAEAIVPAVVRRIAKAFHAQGADRLRLSLGFGMTETGLVFCTPEMSPTDMLARLGDGEQPPLLGKPMWSWQMRIVDGTGRPVGPGETGALEVWSQTTLFSGYRDDPELSAEALCPDGWLRTGDLAQMVGDEVRIVGRIKSMIIVRGRNIALESIETPLRQLPQIKGAQVGAAAVRSAGATTDELAIFFVPRERDGASLDALCRTIRRETTRGCGIAPRHLIALTDGEMPLTATGKLQRDALVAGLAEGRFVPHQSAVLPVAAGAPGLQGEVAAIWQEVLRLDVPPGPNADFFDLGGDSLALAALFAAIEQRFGRIAATDGFFDSPTVETLARALAAADEQPSHARPRGDAGEPARLVAAICGFTTSWRGQRLFPESLVIGRNTSGGRKPLFWVFQGEEELDALCASAGPDQPVYAMRSCVAIPGFSGYRSPAIEAVCDRYLWEILALGIDHPIQVGGNCQGAILALHIARKLVQIGRPPSRLILMEWAFDHGAYGHPTVLLYGEKSPVARLYRPPRSWIAQWRRDFPRARTAAIPGSHGEFFTLQNVSGLVAALMSEIDEATRVSSAAE